jgi:hypothetical protein
MFAFFMFTAATHAQCTAVGPGCRSSGMNLACGNPRVGTNWIIGEQSAVSCGGSVTNPVPMLTLFGSCFVPGLPLDPPLMCAACGGCELNVLPIDFMVQWSWPPRTLTIPLPANPRLIGFQFCIQNACFDIRTACFCMSGAWQVTLMP